MLEHPFELQVTVRTLSFYYFYHLVKAMISIIRNIHLFHTDQCPGLIFQFANTKTEYTNIENRKKANVLINADSFILVVLKVYCNYFCRWYRLVI